MKPLTIKDVKAYVANRVTDLTYAWGDATDPNKRFEIAISLDEMHRFSAWIEVQECKDTAEDRDGREL